MSPAFRVLARSSFRVSSHAFNCAHVDRSIATRHFNCCPAQNSRVPVLIVGAGPVGLSLSILLSKYGIRSTVVERRSELPQHPQAHFINNRTMEIFRRMDGLAKEIQGEQPPLDQWRKFVYCNTLVGPILGTVDHVKPEDILEKNSPTSIAHFPQHRLLPILFKRAQKLYLALHDENNTDGDNMEGILLGHELLSVETNSNGVKARVLALAGSIKEVECRYLVATDGAGSCVRRFMGVGMQGESEIQNLISVHFMSKELGHYLLTNHPGMLYFVFNVQTTAIIVAHNLQLGEFVAQIPYYPPQQVYEHFTKEVCRELICDIAGIKNLMMEVKTIKTWVMHAQVADTFVCGHARVILAGDAAHRFPPAGGFGMNTGIQDAHNLAWKLAAILNNGVPQELLFTYEAERRQIARANAALSVANFNAALEIPLALGLNPSTARTAQKLVTGASWLPSSLQRAILDRVFAVGRLQVSKLVLNRSNPLGSFRLDQVQKILNQGGSLQLQFPAEDLGFRYLQGALLSEKLDANGQECSRPMGQRCEYVPSTRPGARLPHLCISYLGQDDQIIKKALFSTLDLIACDKLGFLLIIGPGRSGWHWGDATLQAAKMFGMPLKVAVIWPGGSAKTWQRSLGSSQEHGHGLTKEESYLLFEWGYENKEHVIQVEDVDSSWWNLCGVPSCGAILVRPDDHVAWRSTERAENDAASKVETVLKYILEPQIISSQYSTQLLT